MSFSIKDFQETDRVLKRKQLELRKRGPLESARDRALSQSDRKNLQMGEGRKNVARTAQS